MRLINSKCPQTLLLIALLAFCQTGNSATTVWIDTDPSIGSPIREVDDAYALLLAFRSPELTVVGLSTTYGNAPLARTTAVARDLVTRFAAARDLSVYPGASSARDLGVKTPATEALASALSRNEKITYVALGPLTNLATFVQSHPRLASRIERVVFVGARSPEARLGFGPHGWFEIHDANVVKDPAGAKVILHSRIPISLVPIQVCGQLTIDNKDLARLRGCSPAGDYLARQSWFWLGFWQSYVQNDGGPIFDALAVVAAALPRMVVTELRAAEVTEADELIAHHRPVGAGREVTWVRGFQPEAHEAVIERLCKRPMNR